ncbi:hypothetical protein [Janthinobacterium sp. SUN033]|uniref:hypothetical protein n=1 Tax=Janthinobacterium sp. SUN033 TaxID=3002439 RepID=UPI0025AEE3ED|nr:hypothetical protein [Janthinobacterium sp. SUN033]MDN2675914.1 hypothetical protein [Janthinobacterium sp. SUN033]
MNEYFVAARATIGLVAMIHSVWGEKLIFNRLRCGKLAPSNGGGVLLEWQVRIQGASRHALTVFGLCIAAVLLRLGWPGRPWYFLVPGPGIPAESACSPSHFLHGGARLDCFAPDIPLFFKFRSCVLPKPNKQKTIG